MGLPLLAKTTGTDKSTRLASSKAETKGTLSSSHATHSSSMAQAKEQSPKKTEITVTHDISRAVASSSLASKQESSPSTSTKTAHNEASALITRNSSMLTSAAGISPVRTGSNPGHARAGERLARVTAYWAGEGDYYTGRCISATGVRLHDGHCAVDPNIIPYGSVVEIPGVGKYLAVDTGSAVISRTAAREGGHTSAERHALVIDLFFENRREGERFAAAAAKFTSISWWTPTSMGMEAKAARSLCAEENWSKIQSKQL